MDKLPSARFSPTSSSTTGIHFALLKNLSQRFSLATTAIDGENTGFAGTNRSVPIFGRPPKPTAHIGLRQFTNIIFMVLAVLGLSLPVADSALAQGEYARRAGAEIRVILGDARRLVNEPTLSQQHRKGLNDRIRGGLAGLEILLRMADQETGNDHRVISKAITGLRLSFADNKLVEFIQQTKVMAALYALQLPVVSELPGRAQTLYDELCAGCHDEPNLKVERPALNLFKQSQNQPSMEFLARLMVGVRGDKVTGYGNPLSDAQIMGLVAYFKAGKPR